MIPLPDYGIPAFAGIKLDGARGSEGWTVDGRFPEMIRFPPGAVAA